MRASAAVCLLLAGLGVISGSGCGKASVKTERVAGVILLDGKPLEEAEIRFYNGDFVSVAVSNKEGKYELVQGAVAGENKVTVRKIEGGMKFDPEAGYDMGQMEAQLEAMQQASGGGGKSRVAQVMKQMVPAHYSDPAKTKLTYMVPEGGTETADLRLTSK